MKDGNVLDLLDQKLNAGGRGEVNQRAGRLGLGIGISVIGAALWGAQSGRTFFGGRRASSPARGVNRHPLSDALTGGPPTQRNGEGRIMRAPEQRT
jgi:hypothetical protein